MSGEARAAGNRRARRDASRAAPALSLHIEQLTLHGAADSAGAFAEALRPALCGELRQPRSPPPRASAPLAQVTAHAIGAQLRRRLAP